MSTEHEKIKQLFELYFKNHNCKDYYYIHNLFSRPDALITSAITETKYASVILEYKDRSDLSITKYPTTVLFEKKKFDGLVGAANFLDTHRILLAVEYIECIVIWQIDIKAYYKWETMPCQSEQANYEVRVDKPVTLLPYSEAIAIISKRDWNLRSFDHLQHFIKSERKKYYGEEY